MQKYPVIFIVGPTATGKTEVSYLLAKQLKGEIVSCDSMLIYKEPSLIISKPPDYMLAEINHHFVGIISVEEMSNVFDYYSLAISKIMSLWNKDVPVVICGGSGLYIKALLDGIFEGVGRNDELRRTLEAKTKRFGKEYLYNELKEVDSAAASKISPHNLRRIIRALEVYYSSGVTFSKKKEEAKGIYGKIPLRIFGLRMERQLLYQRINKRVDIMFEQGVVDEVKSLLKFKLSLTAGKIIGVKEITGFLNGEDDETAVKEKTKQSTRNFAKRQLTWFKAEKRIEWIDVVEGLSPEKIKDEIIDKLATNKPNLRARNFNNPSKKGAEERILTGLIYPEFSGQDRQDKLSR